MNYTPHAEFAALYKNYTSGPDSIAKHLTRRMVQMTESDPLLVVTGADVVLFPGGGGGCGLVVGGGGAAPPLGVIFFFSSPRGFCRIDERLAFGTGRGLA